ncbi:MAG: phosphoenolpyruvate synthase [Thermoplasmata archaeon]
MDREESMILWFREIGKEDVHLAGGKGASLGEMLVNLPDVPVPDGFAVTTNAYKLMIRETGLDKLIRDTLADLDTSDIDNLQERGRKIRKAILDARMPPDLVSEIEDAYAKLCEEAGVRDVDTAVRSSATAEDTVDASFAGQQETYLNVRGSRNVVRAVQKCFASLFTDRAISYRVDKNFSHLDAYLSAAVQFMVRSDLASAGVMFTLDTESGFRDVVYINGAYGLGEYVVQGTVNPDSFYVFKRTGKVVDKKLGLKDRKLVYAPGGGTVEKVVPLPHRSRFILSDEEAEQLAAWAVEIEDHYGMPMDIEWAKDGRTGHLYILQARPETVHASKSGNVLVTYRLKRKGKVILEGEAVGEKIGQGRANVIASAKEIGRFKDGDVLVTGSTNPDWEPIMKKASAIVTDSGGRTCHAAIVSRELGIPCIIGTETGSQKIKHGSDITVDCSEGRGLIYEGLLDYEVRHLEIKKMPRTRTDVMVNAGIPELAFTQGQLPHDGVGLAREEFIINSHIQIHPQVLLDYKKLTRFVKGGHKKEIEKIRKAGKNPDWEREVLERKEYYEDALETIDRLTLGYRDKAQYFIDKLAYGIARIAVGFYPHDVIVRLSDFKTNEYANLIGGRYYEPEESNPMIGYRGASRYYSPQYKDAFALECKALHKVRSEMGLKNVLAMVPFCRTPEEARRVIGLMEDNGLKQGEDGFRVYVMCEIPSNVILAEEFADIFDGFSIGSNDLTQLTLGLDRDSELVSHLFDERNSAVKKMLSMVIRVARRKKRKIGICGQAPSDWPSIAAFLVKERITSMSLNPDTVVKTRAFVHAVEWALKKKKDIFTMTEKQIRSIPGLQDPLKMTVHTYEWKDGKRVEKTHVSHKPLSEYVISMRSQES